MKQLLRKVLPDRQYRWLSRFKNQGWLDLRYRLGQSPFLLVGFVVKLLPDSSKVTIKSGMNIVRKMDYPRHDIFLSIESDFEYRVRLHSCKKEPDPVDWIESFIQEGDVLYDIGANDGVYSMVASKFFGGKVKVYAFEPAFLNFAQLCKNLALNDCRESVVPLQIALSDETGIGTFNFANLIPGGAVHALGEAVNHQGEAFDPVLIQPVFRLRTDDLIEQFETPVPNHIKIDVDGTEFSVLKGMETTLNDPSVRSILLELNEGRGDGSQIREFLAARGFEVHSRRGLNHIFVRRS